MEDPTLSRNLSALALAGLLIFAMGADKTKIAADKKRLSKLGELVGEWKGVGSPKRGSSAGAWTEETSWSWRFDDQGAALSFKSKDSKAFESGVLRPDDDEDSGFILKAQVEGKKEPEIFKGDFDDKGALILKNPKAEAARPAQVTLRIVADGDRLILLLERKLGAVYTRMSEIGYTRVGGGFAKGAGGPECCVTGGKGSIAVSYKGKTYYVCCSGCKDLFDADPEGIVADFEKRSKKKD